MTAYEAAVARLAMLGYEVTNEDETGLEYLTIKCEADLLENINHSTLPTGLFFTLVDMVAGQFMYDKKASGTLEGFSFAAPAKSITEGDIAVTFAGAKAQSGRRGEEAEAAVFVLYVDFRGDLAVEPFPVELGQMGDRWALQMDHLVQRHGHQLTWRTWGCQD